MMLLDPKVRGVFINIFGGITRGDEVARGIIAARDQLHITKPLVVRMTGTMEEEGRSSSRPRASCRPRPRPRRPIPSFSSPGRVAYEFCLAPHTRWKGMNCGGHGVGTPLAFRPSLSPGGVAPAARRPASVHALATVVVPQTAYALPSRLAS